MQIAAVELSPVATTDEIHRVHMQVTEISQAAEALPDTHTEGAGATIGQGVAWWLVL